MLRGLLAVLILGCTLLLAGCPEPLGRERVTDTDRQRLQAMLDEPIIRGAGPDLSPHPGSLLTAETWGRGSVSASLVSIYASERGTPVSPEEIQARTADALRVMRDSGWTVMSASCDVPERDPAASDNTWAWSSTAYKHIDGVSYWAYLSGGVASDDVGIVDITLRAPNVDDPPDLFPDRPAGLPPGSTCIEQPGLAEGDVKQGTPIEVAPVGPPEQPRTGPTR